MVEDSKLPAPRGAFLAVLNHLALAVIIGTLEVATFDQVVNSLVAATEDELQAEIVQLKLLIKRVLAGVI